MTVRPTPSGQNPGIGVSRAQRAGVGGTSQRQTEAQSAAAQESRRDDVQISPQARELQQLGAPAQQAPELSPGRMKQVLDRMSDGHYDRPDVQREVVRRLMKDL
jgi:hypothetical protein